MVCILMFMCGSCIVLMPLVLMPLVLMPLMLMPSCSCPLCSCPSYSCPCIHALELMPLYSCPCTHALVLMPFIPYLLVCSLFMCRVVNCYPASIVLSLVFHGFVYVLPVWSFIKPLFGYIVHVGPTFFFYSLTIRNTNSNLHISDSILYN